MLTIPPEPAPTGWTALPFAHLVAQVLAALPPPGGRPAVLAVDGRSASGKSTLAARFAEAVPGARVVHTDDVAWWESFFGWDGLLLSGVLEPVRRGDAVAYRPPAWDRRGREGAIEVPPGLRLVIVEGVGASRVSLVAHLDAAVWVQSDAAEARRRGVLRDGGDAAAGSFWDEWDAEEVAFLAVDRPWQRAGWVICGTPGQALATWDDASGDVLVGVPVRGQP